DVFEISLTPDELGRIDVRLEIGEDGRVTAHVAADRPETLALLQRDRSELARALSGQGLNADQANLNFTLRDASGSGANAQGFAPGSGNGGNGGQGGERRGRPRGGAALAALEAAAPRPATTRSRAIDIAV
ncbi:MAG: flagellar hook-length control protein FliK, partial [Zavarzinia sp.]|nr:flagellar hook-length control protein FliK [Zavarzinia sp.]